MKRGWFDFPVTATVAVLALVATVFAPQFLIADTAAIRSGEWWRLVTGPLVHSNTGQLARDVVALVILGAAYEAEFRLRFSVALVASIVVPCAAIAAFQPGFERYFGLSGAVYALLAMAFLHEWRTSKGKPARWVVITCAVTAVKLAYECVTGQLLLPMELGHGVQPAPLAHLVGLAVGALCLWAFPQAGSRDTPVNDRAGLALLSP